jgi:predicted RNase H-like HicB family nuclease
MKITLITKEGSDGFLIGQLKEFPAVMSQGKTRDELLENIKDALELYLEDMRDEYNESEVDPNTKEEELYTLSACN